MALAERPFLATPNHSLSLAFVDTHTPSRYLSKRTTVKLTTCTNNKWSYYSDPHTASILAQQQIWSTFTTQPRTSFKFQQHSCASMNCLCKQAPELNPPWKRRSISVCHLQMFFPGNIHRMQKTTLPEASFKLSRRYLVPRRANSVRFGAMRRH